MTRDWAGKQRFDGDIAMDVRLWTAAAAGCAWLLPASADAQVLRQEFRIDARRVMTPTAVPRRPSSTLPELVRWPTDQPPGMMRSWDLDGGAQVGFGRFDVTPIARRRSNLEREMMPMERRSNSLAGAGVRLAF